MGWEGFVSGFAWGVGVALAWAWWLTSRDHIECMRILDKHAEWVRRQAEKKDRDDADWWKDGE